MEDILYEVIDNLFFFDDLAEQLLKFGIKVWNCVIYLQLNLLGMDLDEFAAGAGMDLVDNIHPVFVAVAMPLFVCFFCYNLYNDSFEEKKLGGSFWEQVRPYIPLVIGASVLANSVTIIKAVFKEGFLLVGLVAKVDVANLVIDESTVSQFFADYEMSQGRPVWGLILLLVSFLAMLVLILCAGVLLYTVYFRYLKLYSVIPFSSLAFSTLSGPAEVRRVFMNYCKYIFVLALESAAIMIMLMLCNALVSGGMPDLTSLMVPSTPNVLKLLAYILVLIFKVTMTVGGVKGAEAMLEKWIMH